VSVYRPILVEYRACNSVTRRAGVTIMKTSTTLLLLMLAVIVLMCGVNIVHAEYGSTFTSRWCIRVYY